MQGDPQGRRSAERGAERVRDGWGAGQGGVLAKIVAEQTSGGGGGAHGRLGRDIWAEATAGGWLGTRPGVSRSNHGASEVAPGKEDRGTAGRTRGRLYPSSTKHTRETETLTLTSRESFPHARNQGQSLLPFNHLTSRPHRETEVHSAMLHI